MSKAPHPTLCAVLAVAMTLDVDALRRATASDALPSTFAIDTPGPDLTFACEGSIAGTWMITDVSVESVVSSPPRCPGRRVDALTGSGTLVLNRDGTFADTTTLMVEGTSFIPTSSRAPTCALLERQLANQERVRSVSCSDDVAGSCACSMRLNPLSHRPRYRGRYKVVGSQQFTEVRCVAPNVIKVRRAFEGSTYVLTAEKVEA